MERAQHGLAGTKGYMLVRWISIRTALTPLIL